MAVKLIAVDLDDTLLDSNRDVSRENREAIARAQSSGITVVLASGRMYPSVKPIYDGLGLASPIMCCNGAYAVSPSGEVLFRAPVGLQIARSAIKYARENSLHIQYYLGNDYFYEKHGSESALYERLSGVIGARVDDLCSIDTEPDKLLIIKEPDLYGWLPQIKAAFAGLEVTISKPFYIEMNDPAANKGEAVKTIAAMMGIGLDEVMCVGDNYNDASMLSIAGVSVAMDNAPDDIKALCKHVTLSNDESGVAKAILDFAL